MFDEGEIVVSATPVIGVTAETAAAARPCADAIDRNGGKAELIFPSTKVSFASS